jgi:hypothetical protein
MQDTLDTEVNLNITDDRNSKSVKSYLQMIASNSSAKSVQIAEDDAIRSLMKSNFSISDPTGTQKLNSQRLYQAMWRTHAKLKPHDFMVHGTGRQPYHEKIATSGISTVMDRGGYDSALRDKNGIHWNLLLVGDAFLQIGANTNKKSLAPVLFTPISRSNVFMDSFATGIRNRGQAGSAYRACAIFSYSWNQACDMYPDLEKTGGPGKIPRSQEQWKDDFKSAEQTIQLEDEVEIGYGYNITEGKENFCVFAGSACTILEEYEGAEYPYEMAGESYIPLLQWICVPSSEGAYNYGIGHLLFKLAIISARMLNMELGHAEDNTYPITLVNTPQGEAANLFQKLALADKMRAAGKKPFVAMEYDPNNPNGSAVSAQSLLTNNLVNEWKLIYDLLINEIQMLGINIKELIGGGTPTATELLLDEKNSDAWLQGVSEVNASTAQMAVEITMDAITHYVPKTSKKPLNLTSNVIYQGTEIRPDNVTLGMVSTELREHNYFVEIDSKSGKIPSGTMMNAKLMSIFPYLQPGSQAQADAVKAFVGAKDLDFSFENMQAPPQPGQTDGGAVMPPESRDDMIQGKMNNMMSKVSPNMAMA